LFFYYGKGQYVLLLNMNPLNLSSSKKGCQHLLLTDQIYINIVITMILLRTKAFKWENEEELFMLQQKNILTLRPVEAFIIAFLLLAGISFSIIQLQLTPHVPIIMAIFGLIIYGLLKKVSISELESALMEGARSGLG